MRSRLISATILVFFIAGTTALSLAGCGSASLGDYEVEVAEINRTSAEEIGEVFEDLGEHEFETEEEKTEAMAVALEEAVEISEHAVSELESVKVPAGMEEFHKELIAVHQGELHAFEGLLSTLVPAEEHGEEEAESHGEDDAHEEESEEPHGEEEESAQEHDEESSHQEEPAESGGH